MNVLLVGATGLVGSHLLSLLLDDEKITAVFAPTRTALAKHPKLINPVKTDLREALDELSAPVEVIFCCLGTTRSQTKDKRQYQFVDYALPLYASVTGKLLQARHFIMISAIGANSRSLFFYNRLKGETEQALRAAQWPKLTIVRPSMLIGKRSHPRLLEQISAPLFSLFPAKYKAIEAYDVARAMLMLAENPKQEACSVIESDELRKLAGSLKE